MAYTSRIDSIAYRSLLFYLAAFRLFHPCDGESFDTAERRSGQTERRNDIEPTLWTISVCRRKHGHWRCHMPIHMSISQTQIPRQATDIQEVRQNRSASEHLSNSHMSISFLTSASANWYRKRPQESRHGEKWSICNASEIRYIFSITEMYILSPLSERKIRYT